MRIVKSQKALKEHLEKFGVDVGRLLAVAKAHDIAVQLETHPGFALVFDGEGGQFRAYLIGNRKKRSWRIWGDKVPGLQRIEEVLNGVEDNGENSEHNR